MRRLLTGVAGAVALVAVAACGPDELRLEGVVAPGLYEDCLLLRTDTGQYELTGDRSKLRPGRRVVVRGVLVDGGSGCQQGALFEVREVERSTGP